MALAFTYNTTLTAFATIYRATSGGTVFSSSLHATTAFDYFDDSAVVNDAIYFDIGVNKVDISDIEFSIGTALVADAITIKWEYYKRNVGWTDIEDLEDDTINFTVTGTNRVKFPLQWQPGGVNINGLARGWVRCRISAVTNITEGGANVTTVPKWSNGQIAVTGGTDSVPATFTDFYDYLLANYPYITISKRTVNSFNFTKVAIQCISRVYSINEIIEHGQDCTENASVGNFNMSYLTSGIKLDDRGYSGSTFIMHGRVNSGIITFNSYTKLYGVTIKTGKTTADTLVSAGYAAILGEVVDCSLELAVRFPAVGSSCINSRIISSVVIAATDVGTFSGNTFISLGVDMFYIYRIGFTLVDFNYKFFTSSGNHIFNFYQGSNTSSPEFILLNPLTPLPNLADANKPVRVNSTSIQTFAAVKYYDTSAGTYTNYTTEASNITASDVPLSGDVGDYYLFGAFYTLSAANSASIDFVIPTQTNDYEYVYEFLRSGTWYEFDADYIWDTTNNLTQTGARYSCVLFSSLPTLTTIDGTSAYWMRLRIVTKGTGSPTASRIRQILHSGVNNWSIKEQYSVDVVVKNEGTNIEGATITAKDSSGNTLFSVLTDSNGEIAQQILNAKEWHFDPIGNPSTTISENIYSDFDLFISKTGYENISFYGVSLVHNVELTVPIKAVKKIRQTLDGKLLLANQPESGSDSKLLEI